LDEIFERVVGSYCQQSADEQASVSQFPESLQLALDLNAIANTLAEGELRTELQKFIDRIPAAQEPRFVASATPKTLKPRSASSSRLRARPQ
jgi:hypothetical protein